jgi:glyceraldehyde 3-phosphate dehydrogenase
MIPTSTGAAHSVGLVIPELKGKLSGTAIRVPTPNASLVSLDVVLQRPATPSQINEAMKGASQGSLQGILDYNTEKLVHRF